MSEKKQKSETTHKKLEAVVGDVVRAFERARTRRTGSILLRMIGEDGGDFYVHSTRAGCQLSREPMAGPPQVEVIGDADSLRAVLEKRREGRLQFYSGGIRVRGDLHYLSEIAHEMGFIKEPF